MEIRCSNCQHVGPAADVVQSADGLLFVCENCGHENPVSLPGGPAAGAAGTAGAADISAGDTGSDWSGETEGSSGADPLKARPAGGTAPTAAEAGRAAPDWLDDETRARLVPEPGDGLRCPKCLHLLGDQLDVCAKCGLDVERARSFAPGTAPWEQPPLGKEPVWEQAQLLWSTAGDEPTPDELGKFVAFVKEEQLTELGVRRLREYLVDHPDDEQAIRWLEEIAATFQARIMVARAQAQISAEKFSESTGKFKMLLVVLAAVYLAFLLLIALAYVMA